MGCATLPGDMPFSLLSGFGMIEPVSQVVAARSNSVWPRQELRFSVEAIGKSYVEFSGVGTKIVPPMLAPLLAKALHAARMFGALSCMTRTPETELVAELASTNVVVPAPLAMVVDSH